VNQVSDAILSGGVSKGSNLGRTRGIGATALWKLGDYLGMVGTERMPILIIDVKRFYDSVNVLNI